MDTKPDAGDQLALPLTPEQAARLEKWDLKLSNREHVVAEYLVEGWTNREIAHDLGISIKTVDTHRGHILKKLGVRNNVELCRLALKLGVVTL